ncbi:uncharacterized protein LOC118467318 [Anopheles albimanus]|uniref:Uncharacterized protein n=1 Tax=Anopheles albimanus TaxID=7167 RepID=A0A182FG88_ANOAL|nr:uncharacterized protein LOC118467318 [Anopheles albimanus]
MSARRGLRTRVYDANMSMVENNYKAALERLERSRRATSLEREAKPRASPFTGGASAALANRYDFNGSIVDEELQAARSRASKVIHEKSVIDQRAEQFRSSSLAPAPLNSVLLENEFDDQVQATLDRIRASKTLLSQLQSDDALESYRSEARSKLSEQTARKLAEKAVANYDDEAFASTGMTTRKALKIRATSELQSTTKSSSSNSSKWQDETAESYASKRANATRARLQDIDQEIEDFEQKQAARARRSAQLKQLLAETAAEDIVPASYSAHSDGTKVTTGVVKFKSTQKKMVSF